MRASRRYSVALPDVEALLQDISSRLEACSEAACPGDEDLAYRIEDVRDRIAATREGILRDLEYLAAGCAKLQAKINARAHALKQLTEGVR